MNSLIGSIEKKVLVAIIVAVVLAVAGFFYWKNYYTPPAEEVTETEESTDLGSELYRQATNPVEGQLPDNPLEGVYKNPFE